MVSIIRAIFQRDRLRQGHVVTRRKSQYDPMQQSVIRQEALNRGFHIVECGNDWLIFKKDLTLKIIA